MHKQEKVKVVAEVTEIAKQAKAMVLTGFRGLTVEDETRLRRDIRTAQGKYRVVRNTLALRALSGEQWEPLHDKFQGNTALAYTEENVVGLMKAIVEFQKENKALTIKAGVLDGKPLSVDEIKTLADLPPREQLIARLLGVMQAPLQNLANVLSAPLRNLAVVVKQIADKKAEGGDVAEEEASKDEAAE